MNILAGLGPRLRSSGIRKVPERVGHGSPWKLARVTRRRSAHAAASPPFVAPDCFDQACQATADRTFLLVVGAPLVIGALWLLYGLIAAVAGRDGNMGRTASKEEEAGAGDAARGCWSLLMPIGFLRSRSLCMHAAGH